MSLLERQAYEVKHCTKHVMVYSYQAGLLHAENAVPRFLVLFLYGR